MVICVTWGCPKNECNYGYVFACPRVKKILQSRKLRPDIDIRLHINDIHETTNTTGGQIGAGAWWI